MFTPDSDRLKAAAGRILARLRIGPATNVDLNQICYRYGARIFELRRAGHHITTDHGDGRVVTYTLR